MLKGKVVYRNTFRTLKQVTNGPEWIYSLVTMDLHASLHIRDTFSP